MKPHKWAKEIKAWADGAEIQKRVKCEFEPLKYSWGEWLLATHPSWNVHEDVEYRIKPLQKEPQYLYVYTTDNGIEFGTVGMAIKVKSLKNKFEFIGKIKLENK